MKLPEALVVVTFTAMMTIVIGLIVSCGGGPYPTEKPAGPTRAVGTARPAEIVEFRLRDGTPCVLAITGAYGGIAMACNWRQ